MDKDAQRNKRWEDLQQTIERSKALEPRATTALRGVAVELGHCETVEDYRATVAQLNNRLISLAHSIAEPVGTTGAMSAT